MTRLRTLLTLVEFVAHLWNGGASAVADPIIR